MRSASMVKKMRYANLGSKNPNAKLSYADVKLIRELWRDGVAPQKDIAARFGITARYMRKLITRKARVRV